MKHSTTVITSKEHMVDTLKKLVDMYQKEIGLGVHTNVKNIMEMHYVDRNRDPVLRIIVEISDENII